MKKTILFLIICSSLFFTGAICDDSGDPPGGLPVVTELEGRWVSNCWPDGDVDYGKAVYTFTGNSIYASGSTYTDEDCTVEKAGSQREGTGTFSIGNEFTALGGETVKEFNIFLADDMAPYDLIYIEGNTLYFGDNNAEEYYNGSSPERRFRTVEYEEYYVKQ